MSNQAGNFHFQKSHRIFTLLALLGVISVSGFWGVAQEAVGSSAKGSSKERVSQAGMRRYSVDLMKKSPSRDPSMSNKKKPTEAQLAIRVVQLQPSRQTSGSFVRAPRWHITDTFSQACHYSSSFRQSPFYVPTTITLIQFDTK